MPFTCCVPFCKGNYRNGPKVTVFGFPQDPDLRKKWLHAIKRKDFQPSNSAKVKLINTVLNFYNYNFFKFTHVFNILD